MTKLENLIYKNKSTENKTMKIEKFKIKIPKMIKKTKKKLKA